MQVLNVGTNQVGDELVEAITKGRRLAAWSRDTGACSASPWCAVLCYAVLCCAEPGWAGVSCARLCWAGLVWAGLGCAGVSWVRLGCILKCAQSAG